MGLRETYPFIIEKKVGENRWGDPEYAQAINVANATKLLNELADQIGFVVSDDEFIEAAEWVGARIMFDSRYHIVVSAERVGNVTELRWE